MRPLTKAERSTLLICLDFRSAIIETGNPYVRAVDAQSMGEKTAHNLGATLKPLNTDQMKLLILHEELVTKLLTDKVFIED